MKYKTSIQQKNIKKTNYGSLKKNNKNDKIIAVLFKKKIKKISIIQMKKKNHYRYLKY